MIEIKRCDLLSKPFIEAIFKLDICTKLDTKVAYNVMMAKKAFIAASKEAEADFNALRKKYVVLDGVGAPVLNESKTEYLWKDGVDVAEATREVKGFGNGIVCINRFHFELSDFAPACLSAAELAALEPIYHEPE